MTTSSQFLTQGAYQTYYPVQAGTIYVGTDTDNSNYSGANCSLPYYKRFFVPLTGTSPAAVGSLSIRIPGFSTLVNVKVENRFGAVTAGSFTLTGTGLNSTTVTNTASLGTALTANTSTNLIFTGTAPNNGGDYFVPDLGVNYCTLTAAFSGITAAALPTFLVVNLGFIDASVYEAPNE